MRRVRLRSWADFDALPEGEWVEVVGGMPVTFTYETHLKAESGRLLLRIPTSVRKRFKLREGEDLHVSFANGTLVARRRAKRRGRPGRPT